MADASVGVASFQDAVAGLADAARYERTQRLRRRGIVEILLSLFVPLWFFFPPAPPELFGYRRALMGYVVWYLAVAAFIGFYLLLRRRYTWKGVFEPVPLRRWYRNAWGWPPLLIAAALLYAGSEPEVYTRMDSGTFLLIQVAAVVGCLVASYAGFLRDAPLYAAGLFLAAGAAVIPFLPPRLAFYSLFVLLFLPVFGLGLYRVLAPRRWLPQ